MDDPNAYWNGQAAERWVREQASLDATLRAFGRAALARASAAAGEAVLDVGCGCGDTSLALSERVGGKGRVVGVDLSAPMLARARERGAGIPQLSFVLGDASSATLPGTPFDLLFSRFGVMFFPRPVPAFAHLRGTLAPGGRIAFVCWRALDDNPWAALPFDAVADRFGAPEPQLPGGPGPFSFADEARVRAILEEAGFASVAHHPFDHPMAFGAGGSLADAARDIARVGPVARLLVDRPESEVERALAVIETVSAPYAVPDGGVHFPGAAWIVTAGVRAR
jgi:SAM-dependent methyltransferase